MPEQLKPSFYQRSAEHNLYLPQHGGVNWRAVADRRIAAQGDQWPLPVWFRSGDGLDQQCTQDNTNIHVSIMDDDMDAITVLDPRDSQNFAFFRDSLGDEFERVNRLLQMAGACAVHKTLYPKKEIAELWFNLRQRDLSVVDTVPEDWA